nr:hypothetical protein Iba_chr13bCG12400 [Ipomoea batatas]
MARQSCREQWSTLSSPRGHPCKDFAASFSVNKRYMIRDQTYFFMEFLSSNSGKEEEYQPRYLLSCVRTQKVYIQDGRHHSYYNGDSNKILKQRGEKLIQGIAEQLPHIRKGNVRK